MLDGISYSFEFSIYFLKKKKKNNKHNLVVEKLLAVLLGQALL